VKTSGQTVAVKLPDVGFGVSQVLPALVQAFYSPPNSVVWMEQPEIHLHPQVQAELADAFISAVSSRVKSEGKALIDRNVQLIIESHSEHLLNRLQRRIAEGVISPDQVAIYFCKRSATGPQLEELKIDSDGNISNWPDDFFGDEMADIVARNVAAAKRAE
jgi:predicted ATPase